MCVGCIRLRSAHGISSYNVGDGFTTKTEIIFIQFQLLIFLFLFRSQFSIFPFPVSLSLTKLNSIQ